MDNIKLGKEISDVVKHLRDGLYSNDSECADIIERQAEAIRVLRVSLFETKRELGLAMLPGGKFDHINDALAQTKEFGK